MVTVHVAAHLVSMVTDQCPHATDELRSLALARCEWDLPAGLARPGNGQIRAAKDVFEKPSPEGLAAGRLLAPQALGHDDCSHLPSYRPGPSSTAFMKRSWVASA